MRRLLVIIFTLAMLISVLTNMGCDTGSGYEGKDPKNTVEGVTPEPVDYGVPGDVKVPPPEEGEEPKDD